MQQQALQVAQRYEKEAKERLRRMGIVAAGLEVSGNKKNMQGFGAQSTADDGWYDESGDLSTDGGIEIRG